MTVATRETVILAVDTATSGGSIFIGRNGLQLASTLGDPSVSLSHSLLRDINDCLGRAEISLQDVDVFACAAGPGSFTGLRVGIATVKALAATLGRSSLGVPTLQAVAHAGGPSALTVALLPAGRGELFAQMFSVSPDEVVEKDAAAHLSPAKIMERYGNLEHVLWVGNGAHNELNFFAEQAAQRGVEFRVNDTSVTTGWRVPPKIENLAQHVAVLALRAYQAGAVQSAQSLSAIYVRPSDPELKELCR